MAQTKSSRHEVPTTYVGSAAAKRVRLAEHPTPLERVPERAGDLVGEQPGDADPGPRPFLPGGPFRPIVAKGNPTSVIEYSKWRESQDSHSAALRRKPDDDEDDEQ